MINTNKDLRCVNPGTLKKIGRQIHCYSCELKKSKCIKKEFKDIKQDLWVALLENQHKYDPNKGSLYTFVDRFLQSACSNMIREAMAQKRCCLQMLSLDDEITNYSNQGSGRLCLRSDLIADDDQWEGVEATIDLHKLIAGLSVDKANLLLEFITSACNITEVAKSYGVSKVTIYKRIKSIGDELRCVAAVSVRAA